MINPIVWKARILLGAFLGLVATGAWYAGAFDTVPTRCIDISRRQIDHVTRSTGLAVLELLSVRDSGSAGPGSINCEAHAVTSAGEQTFRVTAQMIDVVWRGGQARF